METAAKERAREREECSFLLVRYVADPVRNEFVNIGVVLRAPGGTRVRFTRDWSRVRCVDPAADTAMLESLEADLQARLERQAEGAEEKHVLTMLEDSLSNGVQLTDAKPVLAESVAAELDELMRLYVERPARLVVESRPERGRAALVRRMRSEFERAGVWELMAKRIPAEQFTRKGDPLRLDCGYQAAGTVRMFHAVSLETESDASKVLAYTMPLLADGVRRVRSADLQLTAVVEPLGHVGDGDEASERYRFSVETMETAGVRVYTSDDLTRAAETAARELL